MFTPLEVQADQLAKLPLRSKVSLLGNKLVVSMPAGSRVEPRGHSIMAAPEPNADETRIVLDGGKERLVIVANETHALAGSNFSKNVQRVINNWQAEDKHQSYIVAPKVISHDGLKLVTVTPKNGATQSGEARLVEVCFSSGKDGTVQYVEAYANPDAAKDWSGISDLARRIIQTLAPGQSQSRLEKRTVEIDPELRLKISLPEEMMYIDQPGPDFHVCHFYQCRELGEHPAGMGIYIGYAPSFNPAKSAKHRSGVVLGQSVSWFESSEGDEHHLEALTHPRESPNVALHIFLSSTDERDLTALRKVAETLTISGDRKK
jgi:hypothetical protein